MKHAQNMRRCAAALTAAALTVAWLPTFTASPVEYNTWTGYMLRSPDGSYLSVSYGTEGEGVSADFYEADGNAPYNTWYFTETNLGITIKSALSEGQYYLAEDGNGGLIISTTPGTFELSETGVLSAFRSGPDNPVYAQVTPEAVTNLHAGDMNQDGVLDGIDLTLMRQYINSDSDFVMTAIGDLNGDGNLTTADAAVLQQYLLGEAVTFSEIQMPDCTKLPIPAPVTTDTPSVQTTAPETTTTTTTTETAMETTTSTTITTTETTTTTTITTTTTQIEELTIDDLPSEYQFAADWIWNNRITTEQSTARWNLIFDQIIAGNGTLNYAVRWQSYKNITLEQRQQLEEMLEQSINDWTDWLVGYDGWKYDHIDVNIVGWAVLDKSTLLDLQDDEVVYDNLLEPYDSSGDTSNGVEEIPSLLPSAPNELWRFEHFTDSSYVYPGTRFDMYLWATQGWPSIGGCGGDWGQRLSDDAYLNILNGFGLHVLEHEIGHSFGMTDFYGEEGASDGFPPGGFPDGGTSIMMAGSAMEIKDFDGWMLRYIWSKIKDENGRFS